MAQYATNEELLDMGGLPASVLGQFSALEKTSAIAQASAVADDFLRSVATLPLTQATVPLSLKMRVCLIASYLLMRKRGFDPENGSDALIRKDYEDSVKWLGDVAKQTVALFVEDDATPGISEGEPIVLSNEQREW